MSVDIGKALSDGLDRTIQKNGLILVGIVFLVSVLNAVFSQSMIQQLTADILDEAAAEATTPNSQEALREAQQALSESFPLAYLDAPVAVLGIGLLVLWVVSIVVDIGAIRTFVSDERERLPTANFTRRLVWTLLNLVVGFILYGIIVSIGFALLVLPGIFFAVALFFYNYEIIVEEKNAIGALSASWNLTSGNRLLLFVIGLIFFILGAIVFFIPSSSAVGALLSNLVSAFLGVFGIAVASQAYNQLRGVGGDQGIPDPTLGGGPGHGQGPGQQGPGQQGPDQREGPGQGRQQGRDQDQDDQF